MERSSDFYQELDRRPKSYCSCKTFAAILLVLGILLGLATVRLVRLVSIRFDRTPQSLQQLEKSRASLQQKLAELNSSSGTNVALTITEAELTTLLRDQAANLKRVGLAEPVVTIQPDSLTLIAEYDQLVKTHLTLKLKPELIDEKWQLEIISLQAGQLQLPQSLIAPLQSQLANALEQAFERAASQGDTASSSRLIWRSIELDNGLLRLSALRQ
ncbi:MAG: hypothetical protein CEO22_272 [Candidatus Berkelbacteria bacterium Gr01-1014_85]|uniref:Uncharacterized protein n=1 Tax=Candidatus Berkelbacteria bacterium Gr01-1014_85 TaxID=2017150 RepID=A0A554JCB2_9BACT|nr:MAG: hypothetical protein CEO22_272 [Candidatus Berkelbacteria bacterium Gr01-1014_85]